MVSVRRRRRACSLAGPGSGHCGTERQAALQDATLLFQTTAQPQAPPYFKKPLLTIRRCINTPVVTGSSK